MFEQLINCPLFKKLSVNEIESLINITPHKNKLFSKNETIANSGSEIRNLMIILSGSIRAEMVDYSGKIIKIEDISGQRPLAPAFLFGQNNHFPVNLLANSNVEILSISKENFIKLLQQNPLVLQNYLDIVSNQAQFLSRKIKFLTFKTIKGKLAGYMLEQAKIANSNRFLLPKSQSEMAEIFGVTRPSLGRAIRELHEDKIIDASGKQITILNKNSLSDLMR